MKTLRIDLHALPGELLSWVEQWLQEERTLSAALVWIRPEFEVRTVSDVEVFRREVAARGTPFRICLKSSPFDIGTTLLTFMDRNPELLWLDVGAWTDEGLRSSWIGASSEDAGTADWKRWSTLARQVKKHTTAGMWVLNPVLGGKGFYKDARYTEGARDVLRQGKKLLAPGGWNTYHLEEP